MNIFHTYTRKTLRHNRVRTLVTVIGIVLSMALFTAVVEGAYSGICYLRRLEIETSGAYHGVYGNLSAAQAEELLRDPEIAGGAKLPLVGWAQVDSENEYKPYLDIRSMRDDLTAYVAVQVVQGRLPQNDEEILLPEHFLDNGGASYKVGDTLTLSVGRRTLDGEILTEKNEFMPGSGESVTGTMEKTYTVVGIMERLPTHVEDYSSPGYMALTYGAADTQDDVILPFISVHPERFFSTFYAEGSPLATHSLTAHTAMLSLYGSVYDEGLQTVLYGFAGVLVFLIAFGSISLIYNSFSISVSERTRQFGILKSVGATKKQIRRSVLYEALVLSVLSIPLGLVIGCVGIGITLYALSDAFASVFSYSAGTKMYLVISPWALLVAVGVCLLTTLISAWVPAKRALRVSPIEAIRQTADVKVRPKDVKRGRLSGKLFGFAGMMASKNFGRNKKSYRATVISLFLSITLFISSTSMFSYLTDLTSSISTDTAVSFDLTYVQYRDVQSVEEEEKLFNLMNSVPEVEQGTYFAQRYATFSVTEDQISAAGQENSENMYGTRDRQPDGSYHVFGQVIFVRDEEFIALCKENGYAPEDLMNPATPKALVQNHVIDRISTENGMKIYSYEILDKDAASVQYTDYLRAEGYDVLVWEDENGQKTCTYFPYEYLYDLQGDADPAMGVSFPAEQVAQTTDFAVGGYITKPAFYVSDQDFALYYPISLSKQVFPGEDGPREMNGLTFYSAYEQAEVCHAFVSAQHKAAYNAMSELLLQNGYAKSGLYDAAEDAGSLRMFVRIIKVFAYGFVILISLIAVANVFNTISTGIWLRRREFAMLRSIGLSQKMLRRMLNYECVIYGLKSLLWGLPVSVVLTYIIFRITNTTLESGFYIPWSSIILAVISVFLVVFVTMLYASNKVKKDNPIDALKTETM